MTLPTEDEIACLSVSADLWNRFLNLPQQHPDDIQEFRQHLHALQNMILARPAQRHLRIEKISTPVNSNHICWANSDFNNTCMICGKKNVR